MYDSLHRSFSSSHFLLNNKQAKREVLLDSFPYSHTSDRYLVLLNHAVFFVNQKKNISRIENRGTRQQWPLNSISQDAPDPSRNVAIPQL